jgi:hypothetical protein
MHIVTAWFAGPFPETFEWRREERKMEDRQEEKEEKNMRGGRG